MNTKVGTPYYISPDVLSGSYGQACDLWSAGCILYIMLCGYPPFNGDDDQEIIKNVQKGELIFDEDWDNISKEAIDLIKKLVTKPERRLTAEEALQHKWFKKNHDNSQKKEIAIQNMSSFKSYMKSAKLQQAALTAIATQASNEDIKELRELFMSLDENGDGSISLAELKHGLGQRENGDTLMKLL
jgi:calcium-dependent protein kinase